MVSHDTSSWLYDGVTGPFIIGLLYDFRGSLLPTMYLLIAIGFIVIYLGWKITKPTH